MCPLVVESSISSSFFLLAVNDRRSQSHQLDSTSSTGNPAASLADDVHMDKLTVRFIYSSFGTRCAQLHLRCWKHPNITTYISGVLFRVEKERQ